MIGSVGQSWRLKQVHSLIKLSTHHQTELVMQFVNSTRDYAKRCKSRKQTWLNKKCVYVLCKRHMKCEKKNEGKERYERKGKDCQLLFARTRRQYDWWTNKNVCVDLKCARMICWARVLVINGIFLETAWHGISPAHHFSRATTTQHCTKHLSHLTACFGLSCATCHDVVVCSVLESFGLASNA